MSRHVYFITHCSVLATRFHTLFCFYFFLSFPRHTLAVTERNTRASEIYSQWVSVSWQDADTKAAMWNTVITNLILKLILFYLLAFMPVMAECIYYSVLLHCYLISVKKNANVC